MSRKRKRDCDNATRPLISTSVGIDYIERRKDRPARFARRCVDYMNSGESLSVITALWPSFYATYKKKIRIFLREHASSIYPHVKNSDAMNKVLRMEEHKIRHRHELIQEGFSLAQTYMENNITVHAYIERWRWRYCWEKEKVYIPGRITWIQKSRGLTWTPITPCCPWTDKGDEFGSVSCFTDFVRALWNRQRDNKPSKQEIRYYLPSLWKQWEHVVDRKILLPRDNRLQFKFSRMKNFCAVDEADCNRVFFFTPKLKYHIECELVRHMPMLLEELQKYIPQTAFLIINYCGAFL